MSRIIGIGFVDSIASIFTEIVAGQFKRKEVFYLKNIDDEIKNKYEFPDIKTTIISTSIEQFEKQIDDQFFFCVVKPDVKQKLFLELNSRHNIGTHDFPVIKHHTVFASAAASFMPGVLIEYGCIISPHTTLGFGVHIKRGVNLGHHNSIGNYTTMNPGVVTSGNVIIGEGTTIGTGTVIKDSITIGKNCLIGAGSVVVSSIPDGVIAYGNPCRVKRENE